MPKSDLVELEGTVLEAMGGGQYRIDIPSATEGVASTTVRATLSGRLKQHHIRVVPGDLVTVGVSPYDLSHGIITYRGRRKNVED